MMFLQSQAYANICDVSRWSDEDDMEESGGEWDPHRSITSCRRECRQFSPSINERIFHPEKWSRVIPVRIRRSAAKLWPDLSIERDQNQVTKKYWIQIKNIKRYFRCWWLSLLSHDIQYPDPDGEVTNGITWIWSPDTAINDITDHPIWPIIHFTWIVNLYLIIHNSSANNKNTLFHVVTCLCPVH